MVDLPSDASSWDSGDWIDWLRHLENQDRPPCTAATDDPMAKALSVYEALLHAARSFRKLTGQHLGIDHAIAGIHCCIHHDLAPAAAPGAGDGRTIVRHISPDAMDDTVSIDPSDSFERIVVVRIWPDFRVESRAIQRSDLPKVWLGEHKLDWNSLPTAYDT